MSEPAPARIFLRPIGSPLTVSMSGLAIASLVESGLDLGWIPKSQAGQAGVILVAVPFVLQLLACVFSYLARDGATGAAVGVLASSWLAIGLIQVISIPGHTSKALGLLLLSAGGALALSASAIVSTKPLPGFVFAIAALRFIISGVYELGSGGFWQHGAGIVGLLVALSAGYCVIAFELEGQRKRPALPTFRRGRDADVVSDDARVQLDRIANEVGVRETT